MLALPTAPKSIELRHLRAIVAVAEELNFGRAAAQLYLIAALSRQISGLERLLGCQLLFRIFWPFLPEAGDAISQLATFIHKSATISAQQPG